MGPEVLFAVIGGDGKLRGAYENEKKSEKALQDELVEREDEGPFTIVRYIKENNR
jgi:hypothetical protein